MSTSASENEQGQCMHFMERKRRLCNVAPIAGTKYCGEHVHFYQPESRKRVACPLDARHTCFEDLLEKHVKKCKSSIPVQSEYYVSNKNSGDRDETLNYKIGIKDIETEELMRLIEVVKALHKQHVLISNEVLFHEVLREESTKPNFGPRALKHVNQQASLLGHMQAMGLLQDQRTFVEFGAGKGGLSHWLQLALGADCNSKFILVDKSCVRYKLDNHHKGEGQGPTFERLKIDIEHLDLSRVPSICESKNGVISIGKHLCGGATDLMLRCLQSICHESTDEANELQRPQLVGVVLALCCHHRCLWHSYVGKSFIRDVCGLDARQFQLVCSMSSWATCGWKNDQASATPVTPASDDPEMQQEHMQISDNISKYGGLTMAECEQIGQLCKDLIDTGRRHFVEKSGLTARLVQYVDKSCTLENVALLAYLPRT